MSWYYPDTFATEVRDAFWAIASRYLPLVYRYDTLYVSPEAAQHVPADARMGTSIDLNLHGTEMRLQRKTRRPADRDRIVDDPGRLVQWRSG